MKNRKTLRLILGDQLNYHHSWFSQVNEDVVYVMMEMRQETDYVRHHAQKVIAFFAAMYNFSEYLRKKGHAVIHLKINDKGNMQRLELNLQKIITERKITHFEYLLPDEYRLDQQLISFCQKLSITSAVADTEHFITRREELGEIFSGKKSYLMETFYRKLRKKTGILMEENDQPLGGQWNFDSENRKPFSSAEKIIPPKEFKHNYESIWKEITKSGAETMGESLEVAFPWPTTRKESLKVLDFFLEQLLPQFGTYQDAMTVSSWSLFHARISFSLNTKMISPLEVIKAAERCYRENPERYGLQQVEGFVRQILGWREYMRGIYWAQMPSYSSLNFFQHRRSLPEWFWTGETKMNCLRHCIQQSLKQAYAHHIQRLMVTGNFALLAGVSPDEVDRWYLGIYIDAIEWVEITNTRGMSQFADGGIVGTKPYVSSAAYIHKMSDYCKGCVYNHKLKTGENACPFNSFYWNFLDEHRSKLEKNPRMSMMYRVWDKLNNHEKAAILKTAADYLGQLENL